MGRDLDPRVVWRLRYVKTAAMALVVAAAAAVVVHAMASASGGIASRLVAATAGGVVTLGPFAMGGIVGFLFGIPKTRQIDAPHDGAGARTSTLLVNTNLEQISDWLTKILVGVGLTQLTKIPSELQSMAQFVAAAIGDGTVTEGRVAVATAILVFFGVAGFLGGYLITRMILGPAMRASEQPDAALVAKVIEAPLRAADQPSTAEAAMLEYKLDDMRTPDQLIAYGRAKLADQAPGDAVVALGRAFARAPGDRRAVESLAYASLYDAPPQGFERAINVITDYLTMIENPTKEDADLIAYLACALGQKLAWMRVHQPNASTVDVRAAALGAVRQAIALDAEWKPRLRKFAYASAGSRDDDLVALKGDPEFEQLVR